MRYFTVEEAESLIPELEELFQALFELRTLAEPKMRRIQELEAQGAEAERALETGRLEFLVKQMNEYFQKILDKGALPKGLDPALVDFPYRLSGREVYLCWQRGETKITHYHGLSEGIAGRQLLPQSASLK